MHTKPIINALTVPAFLAGCGNMEYTHVAPGQSARVEAQIRIAPAAKPIAGAPMPGVPLPASTGNDLPLPALPGTPGLPVPEDTANKVTDAYTRGDFAKKAGKTDEAIAAFEETVKLDPNFSDAWSQLAELYSKTGNDVKAIEAYKKAKKLGQPNGPTAPVGGTLIP